MRIHPAKCKGVTVINPYIVQCKIFIKTCLILKSEFLRNTFYAWMQLPKRDYYGLV